MAKRKAKPEVGESAAARKAEAKAAKKKPTKKAAKKGRY